MSLPSLPSINYFESERPVRWLGIRNEFELEREIKFIINRYSGRVMARDLEHSLRREIFDSLNTYCTQLGIRVQQHHIKIETNFWDRHNQYSFGTTVSAVRNTYVPEVDVRIDKEIIQKLQNTPEWINFREQFKAQAIEQAREVVSFHGHKISNWNNAVGPDIEESQSICEACQNKFVISRMHWHEYVLKINGKVHYIFNIHNIRMPPTEERQANLICEKYIAML